MAMKKSELRELYLMMFPEYPDIVNITQLQSMLGISRHLDTPEDVQRFLARMDKEMDAITAARSKIRNKQRGCADPAERVELKKSCAACTAELSRLRKQKQTAYNMIEDNPKLKDHLACEWDAWVENDPYLSPREKQALRNQRPPQEEKTSIR